MVTQVREIVDEMFAAFANKDVAKIVETFSEDAVLIYHGTKIMPAAKFKGKIGATMFFEFNINALEVISFRKNEYFEDGGILIVTGDEHFISKQDGTHLKNKWVQIYKVENGLISRMEEFATSAQPEDYGGNYNA